MKQAELADGAWGSEKIPEIEEPAEEYRLAKKERVDTVLKLKEIEDTKYELLSDAMDANKKKLGPKGIYRYEDSNGDRQEVKRGKPKVTVRKVKPPKKSNDEASSESGAINPGGSEGVEELDE